MEEERLRGMASSVTANYEEYVHLLITLLVFPVGRRGMVTFWFAPLSLSFRTTKMLTHEQR